ncbi:MAG: hypothetical protein U1F77_03905 [Kiritimatiellia bacterium]
MALRHLVEMDRAGHHGSIIADTLGSKIDTVLAVYGGTAVDALTLLAANDDAPAGRTSKVNSPSTRWRGDLRLRPGRQGGRRGAGRPQHHLAPANDDFANAIVATGSPYRSTGANQGLAGAGSRSHAGIAGGGRCGGPGPRRRAPPTPSAPRGAVRRAAGRLHQRLRQPDDLVAVAGNDDANSGTTTSRAVLNATAGVTYHIAVDGKAGAYGRIVFEISTPPGNDDFWTRLTFTTTSRAPPTWGPARRTWNRGMAATRENRCGGPGPPPPTP